MLVPLVVCLVGLVTYALATHAKVAEIGRLLFFVGAMWLVWVLAGRAIRLP